MKSKKLILLLVALAVVQSIYVQWLKCEYLSLEGMYAEMGRRNERLVVAYLKDKFGPQEVATRP